MSHTAREIIMSLPERFKTDSVDEDFETVFHFTIDGDNGGEFTVKVEDQTCFVEEGLNGDPRCEVKTTDSTYEKIELGKTNPQMAFMMGKIKISNIGAMLKFIDSFERLH